MADNTDYKSDTDVFAWINEDGTSDEGHELRVEHLQNPNTLMQVQEGGDWILQGTLERDDPFALDNTLGGSGTMCEFEKTSTTRLQVSYVSASGQVRIRTLDAQDLDITVKSAGDILAVLDHDDASASNAFRLRNSDGNDCVTIADDATFEVSNDGTVSIRFSISGGDARVESGVSATYRGYVYVRRDSDSGAERCAVLTLEDQEGTDWYLWVDSNDRLRISEEGVVGDPGADPDRGVIVGTQT